MNEHTDDLEVDETDAEGVTGGVALPHTVAAQLAQQTEGTVKAKEDSLIVKKVPGY